MSHCHAPSSKKRRTIIACAVCGCLLASGIAAAVIASGEKKIVPPEPKTENRQEVMEFIASDRFNQMPLDDRIDYLAELRALQKDRPMMGPPPPSADGKRPEPTEQQKKAFENMRRVRRAEMNRKLDKFFQMSKEEQNRQLDEDILEHEKRRAEMEKRRAEMEKQKNAENKDFTLKSDNRNKRHPGDWGPPSADQQRAHEAEHDPVEGGKMQIYMDMMRQRREGKR